LLKRTLYFVLHGSMMNFNLDNPEHFEFCSAPEKIGHFSVLMPIQCNLEITPTVVHLAGSTTRTSNTVDKVRNHT